MSGRNPGEAQGPRGLLPRGGRSGVGNAAQLLPRARLAGPMPWVIAIMVALVVIAAAGGLALSNLADGARAELSGGATVQIVEADAAAREDQAQAAMDFLATDARVQGMRRVADAELDALLEPWLGTSTQAGAEQGGEIAVPVPALIDVRLAGDAAPDTIARLQADLEAVAPAARIDAQASWLAPVFDAIASLQWLSLALVALLAFTGAAAVWLAARSALGSNRDTIEVVHLLGGTDGQIAGIFQRSIGLDAVLGGAAGLVLGLGAVLLLGNRFAGLGSGMVAGGGLGWTDWVMLALVPVIGAAIAMATARATVLLALRRML